MPSPLQFATRFLPPPPPFLVLTKRPFGPTISHAKIMFLNKIKENAFLKTRDFSKRLAVFLKSVFSNRTF
jgi:hypothetical protein